MTPSRKVRLVYTAARIRAKESAGGIHESATK
jgi:hypothetical protein